MERQRTGKRNMVAKKTANGFCCAYVGDLRPSFSLYFLRCKGSGVAPEAIQLSVYRSFVVSMGISNPCPMDTCYIHLGRHLFRQPTFPAFSQIITQTFECLLAQTNMWEGFWFWQKKEIRLKRGLFSLAVWPQWHSHEILLYYFAAYCLWKFCYCPTPSCTKSQQSHDSTLCVF